MARPSKYATDAEREAAKRQRQREYYARKKGDSVNAYNTYQTEEARREGYTERHERYNARKRPREEWTPRFVGVDGESFETGELLPDGTPKQAYCLLLRHDKESLYNPEGLSTWDCLRYLTDQPPGKTAFVGFFLNFDFEWILKDLTQAEYKALQHGETVPIFDHEYILQWFVGKKLVIYTLKPQFRRMPPEERKLNKAYRMITIQDVQGFFQQSFVSALEKWGFADDSRLNIIRSGKAARGGFQHKDLARVAEYNAMEMELLEELMQKVYDSFKAAYDTVGLPFKVNSQTWSGPGVFANAFLKETGFADEHEFPEEAFRKRFGADNQHEFGNDLAVDYPFSLAYFGGRIELAAVGKFKKGAYNYDINSAYPYALSLLPSWRPEDFYYYDYIGPVHDTEARAFLDRRLMGMYTVSFAFPEGWSWYPFPVRDIVYGAPNVFYPRQGRTRIMSPELFAVLDTLTEEELQYVEILDAIVISDTDGYGDALRRMEPDRLCSTARWTLKLADVRLQCKAASKRVGTPEERPGDAILAQAEKALKLILNSLYGKTVQQVGSHRYYNDFASAWITSTCRALLWRGLAPERAKQTVLMTMTDGLYSLVPLEFPEVRQTDKLGDWEAEHFDYMETFKPGVYRYKKNGKETYRVRGFLTPKLRDRQRLFRLTWAALKKGEVSLFPAKAFLTRNLALEGWRREPYIRQFYVDRKEIKSDLGAKRAPDSATGWTIPWRKSALFFEPKRSYSLNNSRGYALNFDSVQPDADDDTQMELYLDNYHSRIGLEEYYEGA